MPGPGGKMPTNVKFKGLPTGRGQMRVTAQTGATAARGHLLQKQPTTGQHSTSAARPAGHGLRAFSTGSSSRVRQHFNGWLDCLWPGQHQMLAPGVLAAVAAQAHVAPHPEAKEQRSRSQRSSLDLQRDLPLPDEPQTPSRSSEGPFLDAASSSSSAADEPGSPSSVPHSAVAAEQPSEAAVAAAEQADDRPSAASQQQQPQQVVNSVNEAASPTASAASSGNSASTAFNFRNRDHVVVSILFPKALSGFVVGRRGDNIHQAQVPGAKWWLADAPWEVSGHNNLRLAVIQGPTELVGLCIRQLFGAIFAEGAPINNTYFMLKAQGASKFKAKVLLQPWLIGTVVGKAGRTISALQQQTGALMRISPLTQALSPKDRQHLSDGKHKLYGATIDGDSVLEIAAPTVDALANAVQSAYEVIKGNPKYVPFVPKKVRPPRQMA